MNLNEKLAKLTTKESSTWLENAEWRKQNRGWLKKSAIIALKVLNELRMRGMTQKELAERMRLSAQQVNKIVKGQENLTLETIAKLEMALHIQLLNDGRTEVVTVLNFGQLPVVQKQYGGMMYENFITTPFIEARTEDLNYGECTIYSVVGKGKGLQIHPERS